MEIMHILHTCEDVGRQADKLSLEFRNLTIRVQEDLRHSRRPSIPSKWDLRQLALEMCDHLEHIRNCTSDLSAPLDVADRRETA